jgi:uncharacterized protein YndB with AHSA1/START domain
MVIEESVLIEAGMDRVWETFTDLACWPEWSRAVTPLPGGEAGRLQEGGRFRFCVRPFAFPVHFEPRVEEVKPRERLVWYGTKYGVSARHEFSFKETTGGVLLRSRETFAGLLMPVLALFFPAGRIRALTASMLMELKEAAEIQPVPPRRCQ